MALEIVSSWVDQRSIVWRLSCDLPVPPGKTLSLTVALPNEQCIKIRSCQTVPTTARLRHRTESRVIARQKWKRRGIGGRVIVHEDEPVPPWEWSRDCVCPVERDVHGLQEILGFKQPAGFLDRLRKRCVKVNGRLSTVFFGSEF